MKGGMIDRHFTDHWRKAKQRAPRNPEQDMPDVDEGVGCGSVADMQFFDTELQSVRIEADPCHADGAMETVGKAAGDDVLRDQRHADKAHEAENDEHDDDGFAGPPKPSRTAKAEPAKRVGPGALGASPEFVRQVV